MPLGWACRHWTSAALANSAVVDDDGQPQGRGPNQSGKQDSLRREQAIFVSPARHPTQEQGQDNHQTDREKHKLPSGVDSEIAGVRICRVAHGVNCEVSFIGA